MPDSTGGPVIPFPQPLGRGRETRPITLARRVLQSEPELGARPRGRWPWLSLKTEMDGFVQREERPLLGGERKPEEVQARVFLRVNTPLTGQHGPRS